MPSKLIPGFEEIYSDKHNLFNQILFRYIYSFYSPEPKGALFDEIRRQKAIEKIQKANRNLLHYQYLEETKSSSWRKLDLTSEFNSRLIIKQSIDLSKMFGEDAYSLEQIIMDPKKLDRILEIKNVFMGDIDYLRPKMNEIAERLELKLRMDGQVFYSGRVEKNGNKII